MAAQPLSLELLIETLRVYEENGNNCYAAARSINVPSQTFQHRLYRAKEHFPDGVPENGIHGRWSYPRMVTKEAPNTKWIIGSDLHIWDGDPPLVYKAFVKIAKTLKVDGIVLNGDIIDGARISRHPSTRGSKAPKIEKEIETAKKWIKMLPKVKHQLWTMGNHDIRIDNYIAANASELDGYIMSLQEHFTDWEIAWAFEINGTEVRHRFRSGIHSGYNSSMNAGVSTITGHTHQLQVTALRDRKGTRWGVETGTLADPHGPQFQYTEGAPSRAQMGFVVISFDEEGNMMPPELCVMIGGRPVFRGQYVF
jgi:UDP-2,3-diacylglucosamine pyrophosphatase LpxH